MGLDTVLEVECSGQGLSSDTELLGMSIFSAEDDAVLALVNVGTGRCSASVQFSACRLHESDSRQTKLTTLVLGFRDSDVRRFGCNVTSLNSDKRFHVRSWYVTIRSLGKQS